MARAVFKTMGELSTAMQYCNSLNKASNSIILNNFDTEQFNLGVKTTSQHRKYEDRENLMDKLDEFRPKLASNVNLRFFKEDERGRFYIVGRGDKKSAFLKIHEVGKDILGMLDGSKTVTEIALVLKQKDTEVDLPRFLKLLDSKGLLESSSSYQTTKGKDRFMIYHLPLTKKPEKIIGATYKVFSKLFRRKFLILFFTFNVIAMFFFILYVVTSSFSVKELLFVQRSSFLAFLAYLFLIIPFAALGHELAHGVTCFHYGGKPSEIGMAIYLLVPLFYVDTSDTWMFDKKQSTYVFLAGPFYNLFTGNICFLLSLVFPNYAKALIFIAFGSYIATLVSFNPLVEADGYYILQTLLGFPNLQSHAWNYSLSQLKHRLGLISMEDYRETIDCYSKKEKKILKLYAPAAFLVNGVFLIFGIPWLIFYINEYIQRTLTLLTFLLRLEITEVALWCAQSFYIALLFIYFPFRLLRSLTRRMKIKK